MNSFQAAEAALLRDCPTESAVNITFPSGIHYESNYGWGKYFRPGQKLRFMTQGYTGYDTDGPCMPEANMAVFNSRWGNHLLTAAFNTSAGSYDLNWEFHCIKFSRAMHHFFNFQPSSHRYPSPSLRNLKFNGVIFYLLSNTNISAPDYGRQQFAVGAIVADNIGNLVVKNSTVATMYNKQCIQTSKNCPALVHVVYLRHGVTGAKVINNRISGVSGDPFRVTDRSNNNTFAGNRIQNSGDRALASDWYDTDPAKRDDKSTGNRMSDNGFGYLYGRTQRPLMNWCFDISSQCPAGRIYDYDNYRL